MHLSLSFAMLLAGRALAAPVDPLADPVQRSLDALASGDSEAAWQLSSASIDGLPALGARFNPQSLASLWQIRGAAAIAGGRDGSGDENLAFACAALPGWYDARLGDDLKVRWEQACAGLGVAGGLEVSAVPRGSQLLIDGRPPRAIPIQVPPGTHLVQVLGADHLAFGALVRVAPGETVRVETGFSLPGTSPVAAAPPAEAPGAEPPAAMAPAAAPLPPAPEPARRSVSPFLVAGGVAGLAAVGTGVGAFVVNNGMATGIEDAAYTDVGALDQDFGAWRTLRTATWGLAGLAGVGIGLHFTLR